MEPIAKRQLARLIELNLRGNAHKYGLSNFAVRQAVHDALPMVLWEHTTRVSSRYISHTYTYTYRVYGRRVYLDRTPTTFRGQFQTVTIWFFPDLLGPDIMSASCTIVEGRE